MGKRTIIQISAMGGPEMCGLYALCDDGTLWLFNENHVGPQWALQPSIPQDGAEGQDE